ncbi:MAG TPA: FixH family protein [Herpetosiphonaceae bacterium]
MRRMLLVFLALLAGCGEVRSPQATAAPAPALAQLGAPQTVDGLTIGLEAPPRPNSTDGQTWLVSLKDAAGAPVDGADVYLDLVMTTMEMGQNKPLATPLGGGRYQMQGIYGMGGAWRLDVHAKVAGKDHVAPFPIEVVP